MKKVLFALFLPMLVGVVSAQKFAYVDTKYILSQMSEYEEAQKELDQISENWQKEIEAKYKQIDKKYKAYQAEEILLPNEIKRKREEEIVQLEKEVKTLQKEKFGVNGELFQKRKEIIEPIQDKIYEAIKNYATTKGYDMIFDRSGGQTNIMYANAKLNKSNAILKKLGITPGSN